MSATFDNTTERAEFGHALIQQAVDTLAEWLVKDDSVLPGMSPSQSAEFLTIYYVFVTVARRHGVPGVSVMLTDVQEIAKHVAGVA